MIWLLGGVFFAATAAVCILNAIRVGSTGDMLVGAILAVVCAFALMQAGVIQ